MRVLILADKPWWIINRITDIYIKWIPCEFHKDFFLTYPAERLLSDQDNYDLIHYQNSDLRPFLKVIDKIHKPFLISIRSHRYEDYVTGLYYHLSRIPHPSVHVINRQLLSSFPGAHFIPDGIDDCFKPHREFTVGFAGEPTGYKGFDLIAQACKELDVRFAPATGTIPAEQMPDYYRSIDLLVCASLAEGHGAPILEAMSMNIPIITTDVGVAKEMDLVKIERSIESIKKGILKFYTSKQVSDDYRWPKICSDMHSLYQHLASGSRAYEMKRSLILIQRSRFHYYKSRVIQKLKQRLIS